MPALAANHSSITEQQLYHRSANERDGSCSTPRLCTPSEMDEVVFQVGIDSIIRVSARKSVLSARNDVFHAMFYGPYSRAHEEVKSRTIAESGDFETSYPSVDYIQEPDLDGRAFINLIKYLNGETVELRSVVTAVETLHAAQKYLCHGLLNICVTYLTSQLNVENVLQIFQCIRVYAKTDGLKFDSAVHSIRPSAPSLDNLNDSYPHIHSESELMDSCAKLSSQLLENCFTFIDNHASGVLSTEDFEELSAEAIECIIKRDELLVKREGEVLAALVRWSTFECHRRNIPINVENQRLVLGRLIWHVRFLTMSRKELEQEPFVAQLFTANEYALLLAHADGRGSIGRLPSPIRRHLPLITKPRNYLSVEKHRKVSATPSNQDNSSSYDKEFFTEKFFNCLLCIFE